MVILKTDDGREIVQGQPMLLYKTDGNKADGNVLWQERQEPKGPPTTPYDWLRVYYATEQPPRKSGRPFVLT